MKEEWKRIKNHPVYEISNHGRVKSHVGGWRDKSIKDSGCIIKGGLSGFRVKYKYIVLNGKSHWIHQLVWDHFGDGRNTKELGLNIDHIDEDKMNNRIDNLQLLTHRQNISKSFSQVKNIPTGVEVRGNGRYAARISNKGKTEHLGSYGSIEEASQAYQKRLKELEL